MLAQPHHTWFLSEALCDNPHLTSLIDNPSWPPIMVYNGNILAETHKITGAQSALIFFDVGIFNESPVLPNSAFLHFNLR